MANHESPERKNGLTSASPLSSNGKAEAPAPAGRWIVRNGFYVILLALGFGLLYNNFGWVGLWQITVVALGLGFVIFIHELGHFLVAKWCDVHVETFSIGFGPALPGCCYQWGETTYMIAFFPLGGYVKMVGEGDTSEEKEEDDPRSYKNKTVGQRMAIISAGVVMNVILGCLCFIFVYMTHGVERPPAIIGMVEAGSPVWKKGVPSGVLIQQIGDIQDPYFDDLQIVVVLSPEGGKLTFVYRLPGEEPQRLEIEPRREKEDIRPIIGVAPPETLTLLAEPYKKYRRLPVLYDSAAARAEPAFQFGDRIIGTTDPDDPRQITPLPSDWRDPEPQRLDYFEFRERLQRLAGKQIVIQVLRHGAGPGDPPVDILVPPAYHATLGIRMRMGKVSAVRQDSPAMKAGVQPGDRITQVEVKEPDGSTTRYVLSPNPEARPGVTERDLDPMRLPFELEQWAERQARAKGGPTKVTLTVLRLNPKIHKEDEPVTLDLDWDDRWKFDEAVPLGLMSPLPISGLGIAYRVETAIEAVQSNSPAAKAHNGQGAFIKLAKGDVIKAVRLFEPAKGDGPIEPTKWVPLESDQWANIFWLLQRVDVKKMILRVERGNEEIEAHLEAEPDETWPLAERGLRHSNDLRIQKAEHFGEAVGLGVQKTYRFIVQLYLQLRSLITGRLSYKNLGGPIRIAETAYDVAGYNLYTFILFLGMISVNLAVINFLPIPVLDGGHMVFLTYEKLRGKPASEEVRVAATYLGLAVIGSLMLFVIYLDVKRYF